MQALVMESAMYRLLILVALLLAQGTSRADAPTWLVGCWQSADGHSTEAWVRESENAFIGFSASVRDNTVGFYELMRIHLDESGVWVFTAWPSGQKKTSFHAELPSADAIVFTNPMHDYPQEVRYRRDANRLEASVALSNGGERRHFDKVSCD
jgi:hypothetical protein